MTFCILGDDLRQKYIAQLLIERGIELLPKEKMTLSDVVVLPTPLRKQGDALKNLVARGYKGVVFAGAISDTEAEEARNIKLYDYSKLETFAILNALPSAEGALILLLSRRQQILQGSKVAVIGYGRIAKLLSKMLFLLGCDVTVFARREETRAEAKSAGYKSYELKALTGLIFGIDIIVNTVPSKVINKELLVMAKNDIYILDLASSPGGVEVEDAKACGLTVDWAPGLPAEYSPITAAEYALRAIEDLLGGKICMTKE